MSDNKLSLFNNTDSFEQLLSIIKRANSNRVTGPELRIFADCILSDLITNNLDLLLNIGLGARNIPLDITNECKKAGFKRTKKYKFSSEVSSYNPKSYYHEQSKTGIIFSEECDEPNHLFFLSADKETMIILTMLNETYPERKNLYEIMMAQFNSRSGLFEIHNTTGPAILSTYVNSFIFEYILHDKNFTKDEWKNEINE